MRTAHCTTPEVHMPRCGVTGKLIYWEERLANRAITTAAARGKLGPLRHYQCDHCEHWHLATKRIRAKP